MRIPRASQSAAVALAVGLVCARSLIGAQPQPANATPASPVPVPERPLPPADRMPAGGLSPRNANYEIAATLDRASRTISGTEVIRWRNIGRAATNEIFLHLYWNAWRNNASTWMREAALAGDDGVHDAGDWSFIDLDTLTIDGSTRNLLPDLKFVQPDDGNRDDRTLVRVPLDQPAAPGGELSIQVGWKARVPRTFSRTGAIGDFYFIAQWFPKVAVFEGERWTAHQFHANTEFFSDYGRYDVRLTVPRGWVVGATGTEQSRTDNPNDTTTHRYVQDDVHDFAWTTSPDYVERRQTFSHESLPRVAMRLLLQPEHLDQEDRHFAATAAALRYYGEWYGAYPYDHITVIDPAFQSDAGGMEYPTLFTAGTSWLAPRQSNAPEGVTIHEAGHQFWYAMVGNNEFEDAWLDEGLNTFSEERVQSIAFQPNYRVDRFFGGFIPWQYRNWPLSRATDGNGLNYYRTAAESDTPSTPTYRYWPGTHAAITYSKTALWLHTLERHLGWETLQRILSTFFARWTFRHPRPDDFFAVANEVSGQDLTWFFNQVYRSSNTFDYAVGSVTTESIRVTGFNDQPAERQVIDRTTPNSYRTTVVIRRRGEAVFPIEVVTTFDDGEEVRERWDGRERWTMFTYDRSSRATRVVVDPERVLLLDVDYTNNSWMREALGDAAARRWSLTWVLWLQDLLMTGAFFV
jgi:peptidase M1-like protein